MLDTRCWMLDAGCSKLDPPPTRPFDRYWMLDAGLVTAQCEARSRIPHPLNRTTETQRAKRNRGGRTMVRIRGILRLRLRFQLRRDKSLRSLRMTDSVSARWRKGALHIGSASPELWTTRFNGRAVLGNFGIVDVAAAFSVESQTLPKGAPSGSATGEVRAET